MAGIDDVLERLVTDTEFARRLAHDPADALAGYELTGDDLSLLSTQVSFDRGALSLVEERISKSSMFGLLTSMTAGLGGGGDPGASHGPSPHMDPVPHLSPDPHMSSGIIGPDDPLGLVDPGDMGDPSLSESPALDDWEVPAVQNPGGGSVGGGSEVYIKEVDPGIPPPDGAAHGTGGGAGGEVSIKEVDPGVPAPDGGAHGTGGGAGSEVSIKEVDPVDPPEPDRPGAWQGSAGHPDLMHGTGGGGGAGLPSPGDSQGFNPQPDPPGVTMPSDDAISPIAQGG